MNEAKFQAENARLCRDLAEARTDDEFVSRATAERVSSDSYQQRR